MARVISECVIGLSRHIHILWYVRPQSAGEVEGIGWAWWPCGCVAFRGRHGPWLEHTWSVLGVARARFGFVGAALALVAARSAGAAGVTAGEEGSDARSMILSF